MTDQMQGLRDDIAFLRELTQDSGQGLAREGVLMLTLGAIFGVVNFIYWLLYAGLLRGAGPIGDWLWIAGLVAFFVITPILRARLPSGNGVGSRAMSAAMGGIGVALTAACGSAIRTWCCGSSRSCCSPSTAPPGVWPSPSSGREGSRSWRPAASSRRWSPARSGPRLTNGWRSPSASWPGSAFRAW